MLSDVLLCDNFTVLLLTMAVDSWNRQKKCKAWVNLCGDCEICCVLGVAPCILVDERLPLPPSPEETDMHSIRWGQGRCFWNLGKYLPDFTTSHPKKNVRFNVKSVTLITKSPNYPTPWAESFHCGASSDGSWRNCLQMCRVVANILNKNSRTVDKGWSSRLGDGQGAKKVVTVKKKILRNI